MKYVILIGDGMGDYPLEALSGKTPIEVAHTPNMDYIAGQGCVGLLQSIPENMPSGSDVAILSILGYSPVDCYSGRGPLEAASMGVALGVTDVAFRCNLVTFSNDDHPVMEDFTAGHITSDEGGEIIATLADSFRGSDFEFYSGVGYRHLCVWRNGIANMETTPPHNITGQKILPYLPRGKGGDVICDIMFESQKVLKNHKINAMRRHFNKKPVSSVWLWGQGFAPRIIPIAKRYQLTGGVISAVDLLNGTGIYAGLNVIKVQGATGYTDTNYIGKAQAALNALNDGMDFILLHVEAPDEMGHEGNLPGKIKAIEDFDKLVVGTILKELPTFGDFRLLVLSDHFTPIALKTHSSDPTLFAMISSHKQENENRGFIFSERAAKDGDIFISPGYLLMEWFINGKIAIK